MKSQLQILLAWTVFILLAQEQGHCSKKSKLEILKILRRRETYDKLVQSIRDGANLGLEQCQEEFQFSKWNCTVGLSGKQVGKSKLPIILTTNIPYATRETAFANSISAAGVTHSFTRGCRLGKFKDCTCVYNPSKKGKDKRTWWGGCSENIRFGEVMAKHFLEPLEKGPIERRQLISHNNEVGRKAVRLTLRKQCRCHGITGSCSALTCWRRLAPFKEIGKYLKEKYKHAKRVRLIKNKLKEKVDKVYKAVVRKDPNLFFIESSPDYCQRNLTVGAAGVLGRECQGSKKELEQCRKMFKSCGLTAVDFKEVQTVNCHCKFEWCCKVKCLLCKRIVSKTKCVLSNDVRIPKINGELK